MTKKTKKKKTPGGEKKDGLKIEGRGIPLKKALRIPARHQNDLHLQSI